VYRTCLFCHGDLGSNTLIEQLPVGRRLAFDSARGRLWVVCPRCERWNLTPFDERWEAIEACERAFGGTRLRFSTDEIGLARPSEGTELVRIGAPQRPEMAAWRYGDQFGRRRRRYLLLAGAGLAAGVGLVAAPTIAGITFGSTILYNSLNAARGLIRHRRIVVRIPDGAGAPIGLTHVQIERAALVMEQGDTWHLAIPQRNSLKSLGPEPLATRHGRDAEQALQLMLPRLNRQGATRAKVQDAVRLLEDGPGVTGLVASAVRGTYRSWDWRKWPGTLAILPSELRLALEMTSHEEAEQRWLAGELLDLETAWRDAEALAAIADRLGLPEEIESQLAKLKRRPDSELS